MLFMELLSGIILCICAFLLAEGVGQVDIQANLPRVGRTRNSGARGERMAQDGIYRRLASGRERTVR